jgi:hypothetical protein
MSDVKVIPVSDLYRRNWERVFKKDKKGPNVK